ncbi:MAG: hypothetical protein AAF970_05805 [Bacteroidota bacterium]
MTHAFRRHGRPRARTMTLVLLLAAATSATAQPAADTPAASSTSVLTGAERWRQFGHDVISPRFVVRSLGAGTVAHLREEPSAWNQAVGGWAARVASSAGESLVYTGTKHGLGALLGADFRYTPRGQGPFGARLAHALVGSVTVRTARGRPPHLPLMGGALVSTLAQSSWETGAPDVRRIVPGLAVTLVVEIVGHLVLEFR